MDDQQISNLLHKNEKEGFEALFHSYYPLVLKSAYYLTKSEAIAEDLSQDLFLRIWNNREKLQVVQNLKGYLLKSIKNSALDYLEKEKNTQMKLDNLKLEWKEIPETGNGEVSELKKQLEAVIADLPNQCRLVFSLNRFEGLSNQEISDYLGISKRTVETHISKALKIIREELGILKD